MSEPVVLHSCNHVLCVAKPAGVPTVPDDSGDPSMLDIARGWVKRTFDKPGDVYLGVVHRLDRPVSGVLCFARTSKAAARLTAAFHDRTTEKRYLAVVVGRLTGEGAVEHWLVKKGSKNVVRIAREGDAGARIARTRYRALETRDGETLVELEPITGRPHQLRVALASLGFPIAGDLKYGAEVPLANKCIALHARRLRVPHPTRDEPLEVATPPPPGEPWDRFRDLV